MLVSIVVIFVIQVFLRPWIVAIFFLCFISFLLLCFLYAYPVLSIIDDPKGLDFVIIFHSFEKERIGFSLKFDKISYPLIYAVLAVGSGTNYCILKYIGFKPCSINFVLVANAFIFTMLTLVCSNNTFTLVLSWILSRLFVFIAKRLAEDDRLILYRDEIMYICDKYRFMANLYLCCCFYAPITFLDFKVLECWFYPFLGGLYKDENFYLAVMNL